MGKQKQKNKTLCEASKADGSPCGNQPMKGGPRCSPHEAQWNRALEAQMEADAEHMAKEAAKAETETPFLAQNQSQEISELRTNMADMKRRLDAVVKETGQLKGLILNVHNMVQEHQQKEKEKAPKAKAPAAQEVPKATPKEIEYFSVSYWYAKEGHTNQYSNPKKAEPIDRQRFEHLKKLWSNIGPKVLITGSEGKSARTVDKVFVKGGNNLHVYFGSPQPT